jgi:hypothetical protein
MSCTANVQRKRWNSLNRISLNSFFRDQAPLRGRYIKINARRSYFTAQYLDFERFRRRLGDCSCEGTFSRGVTRHKLSTESIAIDPSGLAASICCAGGCYSRAAASGDRGRSGNAGRRRPPRSWSTNLSSSATFVKLLAKGWIERGSSAQVCRITPTGGAALQAKLPMTKGNRPAIERR